MLLLLETLLQASAAIVIAATSGRAGASAASRAREGRRDLLHDAGEVVVEGGYAVEVDLGGGDGADQHLQPHCEEAARLITRPCGVRGAAGGLGGDDDEADGEERDARRVLPAHDMLDRLHLHGGVHHKAA